MSTTEDVNDEVFGENNTLPDPATMQRIIDEHRQRGELPFWYHVGEGMVFGVERNVPKDEPWEHVIIDGRFRGYRRP